MVCSCTGRYDQDILRGEYIMTFYFIVCLFSQVSVVSEHYSKSNTDSDYIKSIHFEPLFLFVL